MNWVLLTRKPHVGLALLELTDLSQFAPYLAMEYHRGMSDEPEEQSRPLHAVERNENIQAVRAPCYKCKPYHKGGVET